MLQKSRRPSGARRKTRITYASTGVDSNKIRKVHQILASRLASSFSVRKGKVGEPVFPIGHYAGLVDLRDGRVLGLHVDNVGTKVIVAQMLRKYDTIGIDCVAMCANDIICVGLEPISFLDYIATSTPDPALVDEITKGIVKGAKESGMAVVGGETAVVPDLLAGPEKNGGLDLVGMAAGISSKNALVLGDKMNEKDFLVGVESSGIHSNGMTLARKVLLRKNSVNDEIPESGRSVGEELLKPTRIYVKPVLELLQNADVHGLAHITGGGLSKLDRIVSQAKLGAELDNLPEPPPIFKLIQNEGHVPEADMYRTFNMGVGFIIACPPKEEDRVHRVFRKYRQKTFKIGRVSKRRGVRISTGKREVVLV